MAAVKGAPAQPQIWEAAFVVTKIASGLSAWRGKYQRILAISPECIMNVDPNDWDVTNSWRCSDIVEFAPTSGTETEFTITMRAGKKNEVVRYSASDSHVRSCILCSVARAQKSTSAGSGRLQAVKVSRHGERVDCTIKIQSADIVVLNTEGRQVSRYPFEEIDWVRPFSDDASAVCISTHGRPRMYATPSRAALLQTLSRNLTPAGLSTVLHEQPITVEEFRSARAQLSHGLGAPVADFSTYKRSARYHTPKPRRISITSQNFVERDNESYQPVSVRPLQHVFALVRHCDEPQLLSIEYVDGSSRSYITSQRDAVLAVMLDCCRLAGNDKVDVCSSPTHKGMRLVPTAHGDESMIEGYMLKQLDKACKASSAHEGPYDPSLLAGVKLFNTNTSCVGVSSAAKKGAVNNIISHIVANVGSLLDSSTKLIEPAILYLHAVQRCLVSNQSVKAFTQHPDGVGMLLKTFKSTDDGVVFAGLTILLSLISRSRQSHADEEVEATSKKLMVTEDVRVALIHLLDSRVASVEEAGVTAKDGPLAVLMLITIIDRLLVSGVDTTATDQFNHLLQLVASRYSALLTMFRSPCQTIVECATLLIRAIVFQADEGTVRAMQSSALSTGVLLRHFYNAIFSNSSDQRFVSRYLVELWSTGNPTAHELFRHSMPPGLLVYLDMPALSQAERENLELLEQSEGGNETLSSRLRTRLETADKAETNKHLRRLAALEVNQAGAKKLGKRQENAAEAARAAARAAAAEAAVAAQAAVTKSKLEGEKGENYSIFFHMISQDHNLADLIWNQQTRAELRASLEAELREIETEIELRGKTAAAAASKQVTQSKEAEAHSKVPESKGDTQSSDTAEAVSEIEEAKTDGLDVTVTLRFAWNHAEFLVEYPSLAQELRVGDQYLRIFLASGESAARSLRDPDRFFDALYKRALRETAPNLKSLCLQGMTRVYKVWQSTIGAFDDTDYMVWMTATTSSNQVRDRLVQLLHVLAGHPINCEKMLNSDALELFVDILTTAHLQDTETRGTRTLQVGSGLLLQDTSDHTASVSPDSNADLLDAGNVADPKQTIRAWHYRAHSAHLKPGEKPEKGPYTLQQLRDLGKMKVVTSSTLVWAKGMREWVRLDSLRPVLWHVTGEGEHAVVPSERGQLCAELLLRLVRLRPAVDAEGNPVRPVPRAKRVLGSAKCLPHIAQAMLAGSPALVETVAELISDIVRHNPRAIVKLYLTGVFFFVMVYNGSNWEKLADLLGLTHLEQSFHHEAARIGRSSTLSKRSILGQLLPESLICVLANRGKEKFSSYFLDNVNNPEVIWNYAMRSHLVDMVTQHLGDLQQRLSYNPSTLYDYCPIPRIVYEQLEREQWCANYYLANLTHPKYSDWPISDSVYLLRAVLEAWRRELEKQDASPEESIDAYEVLNIPADADDKTIRKAYRKQAMRFHPDKNPAGREMFEKVQKAYELLTSARPESLQGPDTVAILLFIKTQCILFKRYEKVLKQYKYAGYPLVLSTVELESGETVTGKRAEMLASASEAIFLTCRAAPKNADELIRENGVENLLRLILHCVRDVDPEAEPEEGSSGLGGTQIVVRDNSTSEFPTAQVRDTPPEQKFGLATLEHTLHTISGLATWQSARERFCNCLEGPIAQWSRAVVQSLRYRFAPKVMSFALDAISRLAVDATLQNALINAGVVWYAVPLMFRYDPTMNTEEDDSGAQKAANTQAKMAVRALGRLGGFLLESSLATPNNERMNEMMKAMLTPALARRLGRSNPDSLLKTLNSHESSAAVMWNADMRDELNHFCNDKFVATERSGDADADSARTFVFKSAQNELQLGGVYVRYFLQDPDMVLDDPFRLVHELLQFIALNPISSSMNRKTVSDSKLDDNDHVKRKEIASLPHDVALGHLRLCLRALHMACVHCRGVEDEIAGRSAKYLPALVDIADQVTEQPFQSSDSSDRSRSMLRSSAAGSGLSAGAGGARSTSAAADASNIELVLAVMAGIAVHDICGAALAREFILPRLLQYLPNHSDGVGPTLRTLFSHRAVIEEMTRIGGIIDILVNFVGGASSQGDNSSKIPTIPKQARREAGALLSLMCTDANLGSTNLMTLKQLLPDALALAIRECMSAATSAGSVAVGSTGTGAGAAGAGSTSAGLGDSVERFDGDHETPELIWDGSCRKELRAALFQLISGLRGFRMKTGTAKRINPDSVGWKLPTSFRVRYSLTEGELQIGGVFIRVFLKEPTYSLRDPKGFLEACLRRFVQEANHLQGMTSKNEDKVRQSIRAAEEDALAEVNAGGAKLSGQGETALMVRGEDVMTQVTHGIVCLLRVREALIEHVASLGYLDKVVAYLRGACGNAARYNLGIQCVRIIEVTSSESTCVSALARSNVMEVLFKSIRPPHRDTAFTLECIKRLLETNAKYSDAHELAQQASKANAVSFLLELLEKTDLSKLVDQSAAKVHAVAILKLLEADTIHGAGIQRQLDADKLTWDRYRYQKHDLFLSRSENKDYFLTDVEKAPSLLLKNNSEQYGAGSPGLLTNYSTPPPAPTHTQQNVRSFGGFQAPAPAPAPPSAFGGFQAPAAAQVETPPRRAPSMSTAAAMPSDNDPFADLLGSAATSSAAVSQVPSRTQTSSMRNSDQSKAMRSSGAQDDPFADLLG